MWARESFRQHSVGGCPFVSMHSICVGCLLGSALLWIGHWKAQAPGLQSDRCRLVGASLVTACRQTHKQWLCSVPTLGLEWLREWCGHPAHVCLSPLPWPLTHHQSVYILNHESGVVNEKQYCVGWGMSHQYVCIHYCFHLFGQLL